MSARRFKVFSKSFLGNLKLRLLQVNFLLDIVCWIYAPCETTAHDVAQMIGQLLVFLDPNDRTAVGPPVILIRN